MASMRNNGIRYEHKCLFEFPFLKVGERYYPKIEVGVYHIDEDKEQRVMCILDSGADLCVFPKDIGERLGVDFSEITPEKRPINGIFGESKDVKCYKSPLTIKFLGTRFITEVLWADSKEAEAVIGRKGFFDNFDVYFKQSAKKITLLFHPTPACHIKKIL